MKLQLSIYIFIYAACLHPRSLVSATIRVLAGNYVAPRKPSAAFDELFIQPTAEEIMDSHAIHMQKTNDNIVPRPVMRKHIRGSRSRDNALLRKAAMTLKDDKPSPPVILELSTPPPLPPVSTKRTNSRRPTLSLLKMPSEAPPPPPTLPTPPTPPTTATTPDLDRNVSQRRKSIYDTPKKGIETPDRKKGASIKGAKSRGRSKSPGHSIYKLLKKTVSTTDLSKDSTLDATKVHDTTLDMQDDEDIYEIPKSVMDAPRSPPVLKRNASKKNRFSLRNKTNISQVLPPAPELKTPPTPSKSPPTARKAYDDEKSEFEMRKGLKKTMSQRIKTTLSFPRKRRNLPLDIAPSIEDLEEAHSRNRDMQDDEERKQQNIEDEDPYTMIDDREEEPMSIPKESPPPVPISNPNVVINPNPPSSPPTNNASKKRNPPPITRSRTMSRRGPLPSLPRRDSSMRFQDDKNQSQPNRSSSKRQHSVEDGESVYEDIDKYRRSS